MYTFKKTLSNDVRCWECVLRRKDAQCNAIVKLSVTAEFLGQNNEHTHPPSQTEVEVTKVKASIKRKAETTMETGQHILTTELRTVPEGAAANHPAASTLRRNIRHARRLNLPPNPQNRDEIPVLPQEYQLTLYGGKFLVFDSGVGDQERIVILRLMSVFVSVRV